MIHSLYARHAMDSVFSSEVVSSVGRCVDRRCACALRLSEEGAGVAGLLVVMMIINVTRRCAVACIRSWKRQASAGIPRHPRTHWTARPRGHVRAVVLAAPHQRPHLPQDTRSRDTPLDIEQRGVHVTIGPTPRLKLGFVHGGLTSHFPLEVDAVPFAAEVLAARQH